MKKLILFTVVVLGVLLSGCSVQKKLNRLINKNPDLHKAYIDTIKFDSLIIVPGKTEKLQLPVFTEDTIKINTDNFNLSYYRPKHKKDSFYLDLNTNTDTIFIEVPIPVEKFKIEHKKEVEKFKFKDFLKLAERLFILLIISLLIIFFTKIIK